MKVNDLFETLDMSDKARLTRAKALGFDVHEPVYHGTTAGEFNTFRPSTRKHEQLGFGIHVTVDQSFAKSYAVDPLIARKGKSPHVFHGFIRKRNVLDADTICQQGQPEYNLAVTLAGNKTRFMVQKNEDGVPCIYMQNAIDATSPQRAERLIKAAGYNVIRYKSRIARRSAYGYVKGPESISYVVLDPKDLRRANAAFDPTHADSDDLMA